MSEYYMSWKSWCPTCNRMTRHHSGGCAEHTVEVRCTDKTGRPTCPVCNSENTERVEGWNGIDGPGCAHYYRYTYCRNCGVMFQEMKE